MKIRITSGGIHDSTGKEVAVGTELTVKDEPKGWKGRYVVVSGDGKGKTALTNPEKSDLDELDRDALKAKADELKLEYPANIPTDKLKTLVAEAQAKAA